MHNNKLSDLPFLSFRRQEYFAFHQVQYLMKRGKNAFELLGSLKIVAGRSCVVDFGRLFKRSWIINLKQRKCFNCFSCCERTKEKKMVKKNRQGKKSFVHSYITMNTN